MFATLVGEGCWCAWFRAGVPAVTVSSIFQLRKFRSLHLDCSGGSVFIIICNESESVRPSCVRSLLQTKQRQPLCNPPSRSNGKRKEGFTFNLHDLCSCESPHTKISTCYPEGFNPKVRTAIARSHAPESRDGFSRKAKQKEARDRTENR